MRTFISFALLLACMTTFAQDIQLPAPVKTGGKPLMEALNSRKTDRNFSQKALSEQQISNLLWAACGVNREDGRRTAPTARNMQQVEVYVFLEKGTYLYDAKKNTLVLVKTGDNRKEATTQNFKTMPPLMIVYVANYDKMPNMDQANRDLYGATDCGNVSQNVYLYCASEGLNTVVLGSLNRDAVKGFLGFNGKAILSQAVGFPE